MNYNRACLFILLSLLWTAPLLGQSVLQAEPANAAVAYQSAPQYSMQGMAAPSGQAAGPVSYASVSQINGMLSQLETTSQTTQADLSKLRIERWKTDGNTKKGSLATADSIQRNLQGALPEIIAQVRNSPEDMPASFKLYRNLDALYDVLGSIAESAGAFGSKDDFQALSNDLNSFEGTRKALAERIATLASAKESEIARLRSDLKAAQAAIPTAPPKKTVVDDTEPGKKPATVKKKAAPKKPATTPPVGQTPPAQQQPPQ
ncbi:MAG TPA: hypothetical protein VI386_04320 [Candidatus Sulfotelmatobacter sp.]